MKVEESNSRVSSSSTGIDWMRGWLIVVFDEGEASKVKPTLEFELSFLFRRQQCLAGRLWSI